MLKRFSILPCTLYRLQPSQSPKLRSYAQQRTKGLTSFDYILGKNQLYNPIEGDTFTFPNGLSMLPVGLSLAQIIQSSKAKYIYQLPQGLVLPEQFVLVLQDRDYYSLQTSKSIKPKQFQKKAGQFFKQLNKITKKQLQLKVSQMIMQLTK